MRADTFELSLEGISLHTDIRVCECGEEWVENGNPQCFWCGSHETHVEVFNPVVEDDRYAQEEHDDFNQETGYEGLEPWD
jgi:hypothetical protein